MNSTDLEIGIYADIICPWCYLGKSKLERAIRESPQKGNIQLRHHPFQLYPDLPLKGVDKKMLSKNRLPGYKQNLILEALSEGIHINSEKITWIPNTLNAHRLLSLIEDPKIQMVVLNELYRAFFELGGDIMAEDQLLIIAERCNVGPDSVSDFLNEPAQENQVEVVKMEINQAKMAGVFSVPTFVINREYPIPGVVDVSTWKRYFERLI